MKILYDSIQSVYCNSRVPVVCGMPVLVVETDCYDHNRDNTRFLAQVEVLRLTLRLSQEVTVPVESSDESKLYQLKQLKRSLCHHIASGVVEKLRDLEVHLSTQSSYDPKAMELLRSLREELVP